jgi:cell division control protein 11
MHAICSDSSILPEELATQSVRLKEEQLRREEEKVCVCFVYCILISDDSIR